MQHRIRAKLSGIAAQEIWVRIEELL